MKNIISCARDGASFMMGKKRCCLKVMTDYNSEMLLVHYVTHREKLVSKKTSPVLNEIFISVIKFINLSKLMPNVSVSSNNCVRIQMLTM
jgi:hypothetical protein